MSSSRSNDIMRAWIIEEAGGPEKLELREVPKPPPVTGSVLIRVRAFGLNRSEWFTRRGDSPSVTFPRVLGIECVGEVVAAPGTDLEPGQRVAAMMGGMGRAFDGSYAEYTRVPRAHVFALSTQLDWPVLGALPEMLQTTHGSLHLGLEIERASTLLIRGGTSSIGLAALALGKRAGLQVASTTRGESKVAMLRAAGADHVLLETESLRDAVRERFPGGVDRVLELVGASTLRDSLRCAAPGGIVCMTGMLGGQWILEGFEPMCIFRSTRPPVPAALGHPFRCTRPPVPAHPSAIGAKRRSSGDGAAGWRRDVVSGAAGSARSEATLPARRRRPPKQRSMEDQPFSSESFPSNPFFFRIEPPLSERTCALWTRRSQIASATVGSERDSCQLFVGT